MASRNNRQQEARASGWRLPPELSAAILARLAAAADVLRAELACRALRDVRVPLVLPASSALAARERVQGLGSDRIAGLSAVCEHRSDGAALCAALLAATALRSLELSFERHWTDGLVAGNLWAHYAKAAAASSVLPDELVQLSQLRELSLACCVLPPRLSAARGSAGPGSSSAAAGPAALPLLESLSLDSMRGGDLELDWVSRLPLTQLRVSACPGLTQLPDLGPLGSTLRLLSVQRCEQLGPLPDSISALSRLHTLELTGQCHGLPSFDNWPQLTRLSVSLSATSQSELPADVWGCTGLRELELQVPAQEQLQDAAFALLHHLVLLRLRGRRLRTLPASLASCTALTELELDLPAKSGWEPDSGFGFQLPALDCLSGATGLQLLAVRGGASSLPGALTALQRLELVESAVPLPHLGACAASLDALVVKDCNISALPGAGCLSRLTELYLHGCPSLEGELDTRHMARLARLTLSGVPRLAALPPGSLAAPQLNYVFLQDAGRAMDSLDSSRLGGTAAAPQALQLLYLHGGMVGRRARHKLWDTAPPAAPPTGLRALPGVGGAALGALIDLELAGFSALEDAAGLELGPWCARLTRLSVSACPALRVLPPGIGQLPSLRVLSIAEAGVRELPDLTGLSSLTDMQLRSLPLTELPRNFGIGLGALTSLWVWRCQLAWLPASLAQATALRSLGIHRCKRLRGVHGDWGHMTQLHSVHISGTQWSLAVLPRQLARFVKAPKAVQQDTDPAPKPPAPPPALQQGVGEAEQPAEASQAATAATAAAATAPVEPVASRTRRRGKK